MADTAVASGVLRQFLTVVQRCVQRKGIKGIVTASYLDVWRDTANGYDGGGVRLLTQRWQVAPQGNTVLYVVVVERCLRVRKCRGAYWLVHRGVVKMLTSTQAMAGDSFKAAE